MEESCLKQLANTFSKLSLEDKLPFIQSVLAILASPAAENTKNEQESIKEKLELFDVDSKDSSPNKISFSALWKKCMENVDANCVIPIGILSQRNKTYGDFVSLVYHEETYSEYRKVVELLFTTKNRKQYKNILAVSLLKKILKVLSLELPASHSFLNDLQSYKLNPNFSWDISD